MTIKNQYNKAIPPATASRPDHFLRHSLPLPIYPNFDLVELLLQEKSKAK